MNALELFPCETLDVAEAVIENERRLEEESPSIKVVLTFGWEGRTARNRRPQRERRVGWPDLPAISYDSTGRGALLLGTLEEEFLMGTNRLVD